MNFNFHFANTIAILDQVDGMENVNKVIQSLNDDQINTILKYLSTWNTNAKHARAAQVG